MFLVGRRCWWKKQCWSRNWERSTFHRLLLLLVCIDTLSSLTSYLGESFKEAPGLLRPNQLLFLWRASHSTNDLVSNIIYSSARDLWGKVNVDTMRRITTLTYMDFKSWIRNDMQLVFCSLLFLYSAVGVSLSIIIGQILSTVP